MSHFDLLRLRFHVISCNVNIVAYTMRIYESVIVVLEPRFNGNNQRKWVSQELDHYMLLTFMLLCQGSRDF